MGQALRQTPALGPAVEEGPGNAHRPQGIQFVSIGEDLGLQGRRRRTAGETMGQNALDDLLHLGRRIAPGRQHLAGYPGAGLGMVYPLPDLLHPPNIVEQGSGQDDLGPGSSPFRQPGRQAKDPLDMSPAMPGLGPGQALLDESRQPCQRRLQTKWLRHGSGRRLPLRPAR